MVAQLRWRSLVTARYLLSSIFLNNTTTATDYDRDRFCYHSTEQVKIL
ncbi:hypothetical protein [Chroococcidiopsis sp. SAG 2025]|nr:hypothetical protein [Chroococcidiopsis sp. SAG 2025]